MTYKIPELPSSRAYTEEIADFWEIQTILNPKYISSVHVSKMLSYGLDELSHDGIESEDDEVDEKVLAVFSELERRQAFTANNYPFDLSTSAIMINDADSFTKDIYLYLLLCTRLNMRDYKIQNNVDGTLLFEKLCAIVVSNYFNVSLDSSYIFGTANSGNFEEKIKTLIDKIGEGGTFKNLNRNWPTAKDAGVDVVAWKDFADNRPGKLIAFGQCKTGTSWRDSIRKLNPSHFCGNWFYANPIFLPIPLVFLTDTLNESFNFYTIQQDFLVFNRFRIMEYLQSNVSEEIKTQVRTWLQGALNTLEDLVS